MPALVLLGLAAGSFAACSGGSSKSGNSGVSPARQQLLGVQYGRLVDVYSYHRINTANGDRRDRFNRQATLVAKEVVIDPTLQSQVLFDSAGQAVPDADFEIRPFDIQTGHEELLILWDDRDPVEGVRFTTAMARATGTLFELPAAFRGQNTANRPIPVMPRNAAIKLKFSAPLAVTTDFFTINPSALQLLEMRGDPTTARPADAFRALSFRTLVKGDSLIVDTTILGGESVGGNETPGLPTSSDNVTANIRLAIPSRGQVAELFNIGDDVVPQLNGVDSFGRPAVIRDFRSGNLSDGAFGTLPDGEAPMLVGRLDMGIIDIDETNHVLTLNKRLHQVPVRGRFPFVEGALSQATGLPLGPAAVPATSPLRSGDFLVQVVLVDMPDGSREAVRLRAEILQNLEIGTVKNDPALATGRAFDGSQGEALPTVRVKLASLSPAADSRGRPVHFQADTTPLGADCVLNALYYEDVGFLDGQGTVTDQPHRFEFLTINPAPPGAPNAPGTLVDPMASLSVSFTEPMDLEKVDPTVNLVIANSTFTPAVYAVFATNVDKAKPLALSVVPTRLTDVTGDGTTLQLAPPLGHFHVSGQAESYWFHVLVGANGLTDLAGNPVALFDNPRSPIASWSANYTLDPGAGVATNRVGWVLKPLTGVDEDGTPPGSPDMFGQFRLQGGRLLAAETVRFSHTADDGNLGGVLRGDKGECFLPARTLPGPPPTPMPPFNGSVPLYQAPGEYDIALPPLPIVFVPPNVPQDVGKVVEPHQPAGSRLMMRYLEDDFSMSYRQPSDFAIDVEQLYWSPFQDQAVQFDVFDRYTMALAHGDKRPDLKVVAVDGMTPRCVLFCDSLNSSLLPTFADNVLQGTTAQVVFEDQRYEINPNSAHRGGNNKKYVPYPHFAQTYTWRDSRLVTIQNGNVVGLGGAIAPRAQPPTTDLTTNVDSPWITDKRSDGTTPGFAGPIWVMDIHSNALPGAAAPAADFLGGDFIGDRPRDHDPIALPLLVDFKVFPDNPLNGIATGANSFQIAMIGPLSNFGGINPTPPGQNGYYNNSPPIPACAPRLWPWTRVHSTGGFNITTQQNILVDPSITTVAVGGWVKDAALGDPTYGLFHTLPGDDHLHWAQADFVRKVSTITYGFFDTLRPNRNDIRADAATVTPQQGAPVVWPGLNNPPIGAPATGSTGFPDFAALSQTLRVSDLVTQLDPPAARQPAGTSVTLEFRGAADIGTNAAQRDLYNRTLFDTQAVPQQIGDRILLRGNLLNPNFACEAYRYSQPNSGASADTPRILVPGLTAYVDREHLDSIRDANGLLPRYLNMRLVMTNNVFVTPALSPSLRSFAIIYRMQ